MSTNPFHWFSLPFLFSESYLFLGACGTSCGFDPEWALAPELPVETRLFAFPWVLILRSYRGHSRTDHLPGCLHWDILLPNVLVGHSGSNWYFVSSGHWSDYPVSVEIPLDFLSGIRMPLDYLSGNRALLFGCKSPLVFSLFC